MRIFRQGSSVAIRAPAKVNLFLEILRRRADGYHDLETLMAAVSLEDTLRLSPAGRGIALTVRHARGWRGPKIVPNESNTVLRAVAEVVRRRRIRRGVRASLFKRIPAGTGLGGGSSDAAAAIAGMNVLFRLKMTSEEMRIIAAAVGSDVAFFLQSPAAVCSGRGEIVRAVPPPPPMTMVLCIPDIRNATAEVYRNLKKKDLTSDRRCVKIILNDFLFGNVEKIGRSLFNRLEPAALRVNPTLAAVNTAMRAAFPGRVAMSGSGSAFFGLCRNRREAVAGARGIHGSGIGDVFVVHTLE